TQVDGYTDAAVDRWGIVIDNKLICRRWITKEVDHHSNWRALQAIKHLEQLLLVQGQCVNVSGDDTTTIAYINRIGGTKSPSLMTLAKEIWEECLRSGTRLKMTYVPSQFNPADAPSRRLQTQLEWSISQRFFDKINRQWGPHDVDLF